MAGRAALVFLAIGGLFAGYHLSVIGFSTVRGVLLWGLYFGFWSVAVHRLTDPIAPERTGG